MCFDEKMLTLCLIDEEVGWDEMETLRGEFEAP